MNQRVHGERVGNLDWRDWDLAVLLSIGSVLDPEINQYYLPIDIFVNDGPEECHITRASVAYKKPEPTHLEFDLPAIRINRDDISAAQRLWGLIEQYRLPAEGATPVSIGNCLGFTEYETKPQDRPFDFTYTFEVWSRYRNVAQVLIQILMARFPIHGNITVIDSLGVEREYYASMQGIGDLTEVSSLVDRIVGYSLTIQIQGELTSDAVAVIDPAFTGETSETPIDPNNPGVDPGPGGLYGDGLPGLTVETLEETNDGC